jgi:hypothetical protein
MIDFAFIVGGLAGMGAFAAVWCHFAKWISEGFVRERRTYLLQIQYVLAMEELNGYFRQAFGREPLIAERTIDGVRQTLDTIENMTLAEAEAAARQFARPRDHRHVVRKYRLKCGMRIL